LRRPRRRGRDGPRGDPLASHPETPLAQSRYECEEIPCIHVVLDPPRKRYAVFIEYEDGDYIHIDASKVLAAAKRIEELEKRRWREATRDEVDEIAERYLGAERLEEE